MIPGASGRFRSSTGAWVLRAGAILTTALLSLMIVAVVIGSRGFFGRVSLVHFLFSAEWRPASGSLGARSFIGASMRTAFIAILWAVPGSVALGLSISDYARDTSRQRYRVILDILTAIPAVVYGVFALMFVNPLLQALLGPDRLQPFNTLSAGLVLGVFITPYTTALVSTVLRKGRSGMRTAAMALGATRAETILRVVLPDALPGLLSVVVLAFTRALGESIIMGMVAGSGPRATANPLLAAETMTGFLLRRGSGGEDAVFLFGSVLFVLTVLLYLLGDWFGRRRPGKELR